MTLAFPQVQTEIGRPPPFASPSERRVSVPRAAAMLGISSRTLHALLDADAIPYEQPSKHRRLRVADVEAYRAAVTRRAAGGAKPVRENALADD